MAIYLSLLVLLAGDIQLNPGPGLTGSLADEATDHLRHHRAGPEFAELTVSGIGVAQVAGVLTGSLAGDLMDHPRDNWARFTDLNRAGGGGGGGGGGRAGV